MICAKSGCENEAKLFPVFIFKPSRKYVGQMEALAPVPHCIVCARRTRAEHLLNDETWERMAKKLPSRPMSRARTRLRWVTLESMEARHFLAKIQKSMTFQPNQEPAQAQQAITE